MPKFQDTPKINTFFKKSAYYLPAPHILSTTFFSNTKRHRMSVKKEPVARVRKSLSGMFGIKKLAYQFTRGTGTVDSSTLPQQVQARCQDCEGYKAALTEACDAMMQIMQGSPDFRPAVESAQQLEYPADKAPSEMFEKSLEKVKGYWYDETLMSECSKQCKLIAAKTRELQNRGRRQLHLIRTFINVVYYEFEDLKRNLLKAKEDLEYAQEEQKKADTAARKKSTKKAQEKYDKDLKALEQWLDQLPKKKLEHMKEIQAIMVELQSYHDWMASYCRPLAAYKVPRPPNL
ncbi:unnamed protein product [Cylicocyclus nassatus]|uniref:BAR domain-containing protein n=1 Tax=Cylicocyclus nassatus TaxID=53992 RepID=A0AA36MC67_CYLNA|nr:unnamed protein product [Cylicocyclus nassatus]